MTQQPNLTDLFNRSLHVLGDLLEHENEQIRLDAAREVCHVWLHMPDVDAAESFDLFDPEDD